MYICPASSLSVVVNGHLVCFHVLAIVNSAAVNTGFHISFQTMFFSGYMPRTGIPRPYGSYIFQFFKESPYSTNLDSILKSRDITLPTKVLSLVKGLVKAMVFPVVMYGCESWTIKKAECQRIDAFELWCWKRLLRVPWTAKRTKQSILKKISPEYSLEGLMLKLKLQYFGHLMQGTDSLEETQMLGKIEGRRRRG